MKWLKIFKPTKTKVILCVIVIIIWYLWLIYRESTIMYDLYCPQDIRCDKNIINLLPGPGYCECPSYYQRSQEILFILFPGIITYIIYSLIQMFIKKK